VSELKKKKKKKNLTGTQWTFFTYVDFKYYDKRREKKGGSQIIIKCMFASAYSRRS
jgi:hypothetical protein